MFLVEDVMTREVVTLKPDDDLALAETIMGLGRIRHLPVATSDHKLLGLVTHRDLLRVFADAGRDRARPVWAQDVMQTGVVTTTPAASLHGALTTMMHNKYGCLPVVDGKGTLVGILTEFDLVKFAARLTHDFDALEKRARA